MSGTRSLVYTSVFRGYDKVFPPRILEDGLDYVIVTDDPELRVAGWKTMVVDPQRIRSQGANRYYKMLAHRVLPGYDYSLYVDGNIRLLGRTSEVLSKFKASRAALGLYRHPSRSSVAEEIKACVAGLKIAASELAQEEFAAYVEDGFADDVGLVETGIVYKNHSHAALDSAMALWWSLYDRYGTRDQISLPYVQWKTRVPCVFQTGSFRDPNPFFGIYPHVGRGRSSSLYGYVSARSYDSVLYRAWLSAWRGKWAVQRWWRHR